MEAAPMLEKVDLDRTMEKQEYEAARRELEIRLGGAQRALKQEKIPVVIVFEGLEAAGKGIQINRLIRSFDPREFEVYANREPGEEERMRPFLWRFWTKTPEQGRIAIFDRSWYKKVTEERFFSGMSSEELSGAFRDILSFEEQLTDGGAVVIKFFLYISKEEQKRRFKKLLANKSTAWEVTRRSLEENERYSDYLLINEEMLERTDTGYAPWTIVEAEDKNFASVKIMSTVLYRLETELKKCREHRPDLPKLSPDPPKEPYRNGVLSGVDLTKSLDRKEYEKRIRKAQKRLELLHSELYRLRIPVVIGFEGWDAAGKGGAIRRLTSHLDPRGYRVNPTAAPNDEERLHHYLWRFWKRMPKAGHIAVFDRTWYGRVMVERIEGFCTEEEWRRAYRELNEMEAHMAGFGAVVLKFWLHIDKEEQEKRFRERMEDPDKQWKITEEDWRNRDKWEQYEEAVNEMLIRTSTMYAPWIVVEGNSKYYARVKVLETVADALEEKIRQVKKGGKKEERKSLS